MERIVAMGARGSNYKSPGRIGRMVRDAMLRAGTGVADALLRHAERLIRSAGHATAWLAVVPRNGSARRFYERMGWTDEGPFEHLAPSDDGPIRVPTHRYVAPEVV